MYHLSMQLPEEEARRQMMDDFKDKISADLFDENAPAANGRMLAACQDTQSDTYLLVMAVPRTALNDAESPDLWRTPDKNKFLVCINEETLAQKAIEIADEEISDEQKNFKMSEFISSYLPAMFERAAAMTPLNI